MSNVKLKELAIGEQAEISGYSSDTCNNDYLQRLLSLGLTRGAKLKVLRVAPLGDPMEIEVRGYQLSLRKEEVNVINVRRV